MSKPVFKAFALCEEIADSQNGSGLKDLRGAGLNVIRVSGTFPVKRSFWVYIEVADQKPTGEIQPALMRADSGRCVFFRVMPIEFADPLNTTLVAVRVLDCSLPATGVFFVELWYDGAWRLDQRLAVIYSVAVGVPPSGSLGLALLSAPRRPPEGGTPTAPV